MSNERPSFVSRSSHSDSGVSLVLTLNIIIIGPPSSHQVDNADLRSFQHTCLLACTCRLGMSDSDIGKNTHVQLDQSKQNVFIRYDVTLFYQPDPAL